MDNKTEGLGKSSQNQDFTISEEYSDATITTSKGEKIPIKIKVIKKLYKDGRQDCTLVVPKLQPNVNTKIGK